MRSKRKVGVPVLSVLRSSLPITFMKLSDNEVLNLWAEYSGKL